MVRVADQSDDRFATADELPRQELGDLPVGTGSRTSHPWKGRPAGHFQSDAPRRDTPSNR